MYSSDSHSDVGTSNGALRNATKPVSAKQSRRTCGVRNGIATDQCSCVGQNAVLMSSLYGVESTEWKDQCHGFIVVVAPIGTKPVAGGNNRTVPASTRSGFFILFNATSAGALIFSLKAMAYNDSPGRTVYCNGGAVLAGEILVLVVLAAIVFEADDDPLSVNKYEKNASSPKRHVLHNKYIWSRVRRNILAMLCPSHPHM